MAEVRLLRNAMAAWLLVLVLLADLPSLGNASQIRPWSGAARGAETALLQDEAGAKAEAEAGAKPASQRRLLQVSVSYDPLLHGKSGGVTLSMCRTTQQLTAKPGSDPARGVAWAKLDEQIAKTGWDTLSVETTDNAGVTNTVKMYAAGFAEGLLTAPRISQFYSNFYQLLAKDSEGAAALTNIRNMFYKEIEYLKQKTGLVGNGPLSAEPTDPYWKQVRYTFVQLWGVLDGYNVIASKSGVKALDLNDMIVINRNAELPEMMEAYTPKAMEARRKFQELSAYKKAEALLQEASPAASKRSLRAAAPEPVDGERKMTAAEADRDWENRLTRHGHCSALVRVTPENKDLLVGHTTWNDYSKMTRLYKYYKLPLPGASSHVTLMGFSSYPGCVSSTDDYYTLDNGLLVMDTSLEILNPSVYQRLPEFPSNPHIPTFMHIMAVNRMARSGPNWTSLYTQFNSGTGSAQWLIVDYNMFTPGAPIRPNTVRVLEQVPGLTHESDISHVLSTKRYWASYNRPFYGDIRKVTGHAAAQSTYGALYSFEGAPRAVIFERLAGSVSSLFNMRSIMNRNSYPNEGTLPSEPGHAISARMDLDPLSHLPNGGIDAKVTNYCLFRSLQSQAISGPSHQMQPVFQWRKPGSGDLFPGWPHLGLPDTWDFDWVQMTPSGIGEVVDLTDC